MFDLRCASTDALQCSNGTEIYSMRYVHYEHARSTDLHVLRSTKISQILNEIISTKIFDT